MAGTRLSSPPVAPAPVASGRCSALESAQRATLVLRLRPAASTTQLPTYTERTQDLLAVPGYRPSSTVGSFGLFGLPIAAVRSGIERSSLLGTGVSEPTCPPTCPKAAPHTRSSAAHTARATGESRGVAYTAEAANHQVPIPVPPEMEDGAKAKLYLLRPEPIAENDNVPGARMPFLATCSSEVRKVREAPQALKPHMHSLAWAKAHLTSMMREARVWDSLHSSG